MRVLALAAAIAAAPLPSYAGDSRPQDQPRPGIGATIQKVVATEALNATQSPPASEQQTPGSSELGSTSFFKTPAGIITLVAVGAGVGYALYSTSHDRVKSPGR